VYPPLVELHTSRGIETPQAKLFMRLSVIVCDVVLYIPALVLCIMAFYHNNSNSTTETDSSSTTTVSRTREITILSVISLALMSPSVTIIDHGHFQYNNVSLGLAAMAIYMLLKRHVYGASIMYCLAISYKQMALYYAMPIFFYILGLVWFGNKNSNKNTSKTVVVATSTGIVSKFFNGIVKIMKIGIVVIVTMAVCWLPFVLTSAPTNIVDSNGNATIVEATASNKYAVIKQVLHRVFPFYRGLFEDKVANLWCSLSIVFKWNQLFKQQVLIRIRYVCCIIQTQTQPNPKLKPKIFLLFSFLFFVVVTTNSTLATLAASLPSNIHLMFRPQRNNFVLALCSTAFAFFLCSFHVHEKTILFPLMPAMLLTGKSRLFAFTVPLLTLVSMFSMYPLIVKDNLYIAYVALIVFYMTMAFGLCKRAFSTIEKLVLVVSIGGMIAIHTVMALVTPPARYPDLFTLACVMFSCAHFVAFMLITNIAQFTGMLNNDEVLQQQVQGKEKRE